MKLSIYPTKTAIILRGNPGTGKSTLANQLRDPEDIISADKFPGIYEGGVYQQHLQKESHDWAKAEFIRKCETGCDLVVVDNTNIRIAHMQAYRDIAADCGYTVQVVHVEQLIDSDDKSYPSLHFDDLSQLEHVRKRYDETFEPVLKPVPGFTTDEIIAMNDFSRGADRDELVISDIIGTLIVSKDPQSPFVNHIDKVAFNDVAVEELIRVLRCNAQTTCYLASNQSGISYGHMSLEDLRDIYELLAEKILMHPSNTRSIGKMKSVKRIVIYSATERGANYLLSWDSSGSMAREFRHCVTRFPTAKPDVGLLAYCIGEAIISGELPTDVEVDSDEVPNIVYVGDAHVPGRTEDLQVVRKFNAMRDHYLENRELFLDDMFSSGDRVLQFPMVYIPVEIFVS